MFGMPCRPARMSAWVSQELGMGKVLREGMAKSTVALWGLVWEL
jgi:hypothetical protein